MTAAAVLLVGGEPRVDLLPPEVRAARKSRRAGRLAGLSVIGVALIVVAAIGGASVIALQARAQLAMAEAQTNSIIAQQSKYASARTVQNQVTLVEAAQRVGAATEIDWPKYINDVQAVLPPGVTLATINVDSSSPIVAFTQPTAPLQGPRVATVIFTAFSGTLPQPSEWLKGLSTLKGYADAVPGTVEFHPTSKMYLTTVTMHLNANAFDNRFDPKGATN